MHTTRIHRTKVIHDHFLQQRWQRMTRAFWAACFPWFSVWKSLGHSGEQLTESCWWHFASFTEYHQLDKETWYILNRSLNDFQVKRDINCGETMKGSLRCWLYSCVTFSQNCSYSFIFASSFVCPYATPLQYFHSDIKHSHIALTAYESLWMATLPPTLKHLYASLNWLWFVLTVVVCIQAMFGLGTLGLLTCLLVAWSPGTRVLVANFHWNVILTIACCHGGECLPASLVFWWSSIPSSIGL